ncbi:MAG: non-heme iron oxygenase ferredoxin subunit, partial [Chloroflexi bacterium]|nr:non-heme iron oxygenase ferredoxin subunit [Chloroflexota bacterium]
MFNYTQLDPEKCEFIPVTAADDLPNGERLFVEIDGTPIVIFNIAGEYFAIADLCSHDDGPLGDGELANGHEVTCPRHGARFDVRTGKVTRYPAVVDIPAYPVRVSAAGELELGLPL